MFKKSFGNLLHCFLKIFLSFFPPTYDIIVIESKIKTWNEWFADQKKKRKEWFGKKKNERRRITCDHKFENIAVFIYF